MIKPIAAAASMGVVRVDDLQELRQKVESTQKQLESLYLDEHVSSGMAAALFLRPLGLSQAFSHCKRRGGVLS